MQPGRRQGEAIYLHAHRLLMRVGLSLVSTFAWVFVFEYFFFFSGNAARALFGTFVIYALSQAIMLLLTPLAAAHLRRGLDRVMLLGALVCALSFATLGGALSGYFASPLSWGMVLFSVLFGAYRALYWIPYRLQSAALGSAQSVLWEILVALMPAFAGATLVVGGSSALRLLFGAAALLALSVLPVFAVRDRGEPFEWGYGETFRRVFALRYRRLSCRAALGGIESAALFLIWPLAVFFIVGGSYIVFGIVMSVSLLVTLAVRALFRRSFMRPLFQDSVVINVVLAVSGWVLRLGAASPAAVVIADSYSYAGAPAGAQDLLLHGAADQGSYLDEYTALQEIASGIGRVAMCALAALFLCFAPVDIALAFSLIVAALAAGGSVALSRSVQIEAY